MVWTHFKKTAKSFVVDFIFFRFPVLWFIFIYKFPVFVVHFNVDAEPQLIFH